MPDPVPQSFLRRIVARQTSLAPRIRPRPRARFEPGQTGIENLSVATLEQFAPAHAEQPAQPALKPVNPPFPAEPAGPLNETRHDSHSPNKPSADTLSGDPAKPPEPYLVHHPPLPRQTFPEPAVMTPENTRLLLPSPPPMADSTPVTGADISAAGPQKKRPPEVDSIAGPAPVILRPDVPAKTTPPLLTPDVLSPQPAHKPPPVIEPARPLPAVAAVVHQGQRPPETIHVIIGRIEINAVPATPAGRSTTPKRPPVRSLDEYLDARREG